MPSKTCYTDCRQVICGLKNLFLIFNIIIQSVRASRHIMISISFDCQTQLNSIGGLNLIEIQFGFVWLSNPYFVSRNCILNVLFFITRLDQESGIMVNMAILLNAGNLRNESAFIKVSILLISISFQYCNMYRIFSSVSNFLWHDWQVKFDWYRTYYMFFKLGVA